MHISWYLSTPPPDHNTHAKKYTVYPSRIIVLADIRFSARWDNTPHSDPPFPREDQCCISTALLLFPPLIAVGRGGEETVIGIRTSKGTSR